MKNFLNTAFSALLFVTALLLIGLSTESAEAREFRNKQYWNTPALRYRDSKEECLRSTKGWATDNVRWECKAAFKQDPVYVKLCNAADVEIQEDEYTDRYGTRCSTTATIHVK